MAPRVQPHGDWSSEGCHLIKPRSDSRHLTSSRRRSSTCNSMPQLRRKCVEKMDFAVEHTGLDTDRRRLRRSHERFRPLPIFDLQQEEHFVYRVNRAPHLEDRQTGCGSRSSLAVKYTLPPVDVLDSVTNQQHHGPSLTAMGTFGPDPTLAPPCSEQLRAAHPAVSPRPHIRPVTPSDTGRPYCGAAIRPLISGCSLRMRSFGTTTRRPSEARLLKRALHMDVAVENPV